MSNMALRANESSFLGPDAWTTIKEAVIEQCDGIDGLKDGIISNPHACKYVDLWL